MMTRNMVKRVEILFPIYSEEIKQRVMDIFITQMADTEKARIQDSNGEYRYKEVSETTTKLNSQEQFLLEAMSTVVVED